jgi:hypothetical protein
MGRDFSMVLTIQDEQLLDPGDAEASAMWTSPAQPAEDVGQEPYMRSAAEFLAGITSDSTAGAAIGFVDGLRSGIVRFTAASPSTVRVIVEVSNSSGGAMRRLEATVRASWLRRVTEGASGHGGEAAKIATAVEDLAALPGQSTVKVQMLSGGAV